MLNIRKYSLIFGSIFIFSIFMYISYLSPLAGDDWGYALNGTLYNPLLLAFEFYFTWSGRFFSELYGFLVTPNKWFWNLFNPMLFTSIFIFIFLLTSTKKRFLSIFVIIFLMLSVKDELRMETYTWLMGTTYIIPLALSFIILYFYKLYLFDQYRLSLIHKILISVSLLIIGLSMENISAAILLFTLSAVLFKFIKFKIIDKNLIIFSLISLFSFALLRLSPGASFRLQRDHAEWLKLSIVDQIVVNYPNFIRFTFIENRYLVLTFSLILILLTIYRYFMQRKYLVYTLLSSLVFGFAALISTSLTLSLYTSHQIILLFVNYNSLINLIFWPIYILFIFISINILLKDQTKYIAYTLLLLAGLTNGAMLLSPIFSYRSSIYTVYFIIALCSLLFQEIKSTWIQIFASIGLLGLILINSLNYVEKYRFVQDVTILRQSQIDYYIDHPEIKEAWLVRYPSYTIHSGDVEEWDDYHMDVFKRYYKMNPEVRLVFYNEDWNKIGK